MLPVTVVVEGTTDASILQRVIETGGCSIDVIHGQRGKGHIAANMRGYNNAARFSPWIILRDLDQDAVCAPSLIESLLPERSRWMNLRIAVRAVETWLLADPEALADYLRVRRALVPSDPESLADPKQALVNLARHSRVGAIRDDMAPAAGMTSRVGPAYASRISEFARDRWRPGIARHHSDSLRRCMDAVRRMRIAFERGR